MWKWNLPSRQTVWIWRKDQSWKTVLCFPKITKWDFAPCIFWDAFGQGEKKKVVLLEVEWAHRKSKVRGMMQEHEESFSWLEHSNDVAEWYTVWLEEIGKGQVKGSWIEVEQQWERWQLCFLYVRNDVMKWHVAKYQKPVRDGLG